MSKGPVQPVAQERLARLPLGLDERDGAAITAGALARRQATNRSVTIPYGMRTMEDSGTLENFRIAAGMSKASYAEPLFRDSDLYKVLEAVAWERQHGPDPEQDRFVSESAELLARAQGEDGYLDTYYQVAEPGQRFTNPAMGHELYCAGHLVQASVAAQRSEIGSATLAEVTTRLTDFLLAELRGAQRDFVPGHPEIEMALVELYRSGGRSDLLQLAGELIARRGRAKLHWRGMGPAYFQDDIAFEQAKEVRGHAVRALYLLCGATDVEAETGNSALYEATLAQWDDMVSAKTYLTGGIGSRHRDEAFGDPYELPPDRAYCETCAAIASLMWNWRLLLRTGERRFADLMERTLYNAVLSGYGLDGRSFFYVNPLHSRVPHERSAWYHVACCPPNVMRTVASLEHYLATKTSKGVQLHLYTTGSIDAGLVGGRLRLQIETDYPHDGTVALRVLEAPTEAVEVALRIPGWARSFTVTRNARREPAEPDADGYVRLRRSWSAGDELVLELAFEVRRIVPSPAIDAVAGCVAFERGPLVYCVEGVDLPQGHGIREVLLPSGGRARALERSSVAGEPYVPLALEAMLQLPAGGGWPYHDADRIPPEPAAAPVELRALPYHLWANRGPSEMRVFLPEAGAPWA